MSTVVVNNKDEIIMKLVHYFITEENYTPIIVNGVKDEIWLENDEGPYKIVRINSNYIHNDEQLRFDIFKTRSILKQIKKKTLSFSVNALNIQLNLNDGIKTYETKNVDSVKIDNVADITTNQGLLSIFPNIKDKLIKNTDGLDLIINVTKDINEKTERENRQYEKTFSQKPIIITKILIAISIILFVLTTLNGGLYDPNVLYNYGSVYAPSIRAGQIYRLLTGTFLHAGFMHILCNMYALYIIGSQIETFIGKWKYLTVYLISAISGSLMSVIFTDAQSVGASGAIFGLLGCLLYFGYHHRLYLGNVLKSQIIPVIILNLALGFLIPDIDNAAHIGGLVGGFFATMALGIENKDHLSDRINGWITLSIYLIFLVYVAFIMIP